MSISPAEFLDELDAFNYRWQKDYPSMQAAARAAGLEGLYLLWLKQTDEGMRRRITLEGITDEYGGRLAGIAAQERMYADMGYAPAIVEDDVPPEETDDDT